jgi:hypothetical protein
MGGIAVTNNATPQVASATQIIVPDGTDELEVTGSTTITSILEQGALSPGRVLVIKAADGANFQITNGTWANRATPGTPILSGASLTLASGDNVTLKQTSTGSWLQIATVNIA